MTDDLIARLRQLAGNTGKMTWVGGSPITATDVLTQAADRIEAQASEIEQYRAALSEICSDSNPDWVEKRVYPNCVLDDIHNIAVNAYYKVKP